MKGEIVRVRDIMTEAVVSLKESDMLDIAGDEMALKRVRHLPVISRDEPGRLVGIVTHRDIVRVAGRALEHDGDERSSMLRQIPVQEAMRRQVETASPDDPAAQAARRILTGKYGCLPVVDGDGVLVGIVTEADFVQFAARYLEERQGGRTGD